MRVGFVVDRFPSFYQTFVLSQMQALEAQGVPLAVLALKPPPEQVQPAPSPLAAPVRYAPPLQRADLYGRAKMSGLRTDGATTRAALLSGRRAVVVNWLRGVALAPVARELGVTHFHAHFAAGANVAAMAAARQLNVPFSFTTHAVDLFVRPAWLCETGQASAFQTTVSHYNQAFILDRCGADAADRVHVVRSGIAVGEFRVAAREPHEPPLVLSVGRLIPKKGFRDLLSALALVRDRGAAFRAVIVGDGPDAAVLESDIARLGLGATVTLRGALDQASVRRLYADADLFALPCVVAPDGDRDGIPTSLMEAMAAGLPVVSTTVTGIPELVTEGVGRLVAPHDSQALAEALAELLTNPAARRTLGAAGAAAVAREFDVARNAAQLAALITAAGTRPQ